MKDNQYKNIDEKVVADFGREWKHFNHKHLDDSVLDQSFRDYFDIFPIEKLSGSEGFDMGCGSGRWAKYIVPKVNFLHCIDPSKEALDQAKSNLTNFKNCDFECSSVDTSILPDNSQDFGYSLGVLHHIPDTKEALRSCSVKLKSGAPFLLYLYYRFDNKPKWFRFVWKLSNYFRIYISNRPAKTRFFLSQLVAIFIYWPLTRISKLIEKIGFGVENFPLSYYRKYSFYSMRTDALDRFGTRLEHRFTKDEVKAMMIDAGLIDIIFSDSTPYWCAVGYRSHSEQLI